jgi:asparagine synthase (glutamine-hydrolysing)
MCGIAGYSGDFSPAAIGLANRSQTHRGPDGRGEFVDLGARVALGHVRLSILDLSAAGDQPMYSDDGNVVLVFNGEIYNYRELRRELAGAGHQFRGSSDTEVLLHLYLARGERMLPQLNGIFAFALWDRRKGVLFVARDGFGIKPLYFTQDADGFAFASEIKALLELAPRARELDAAALHRYLTFLWCPGEGTPLRAVRKLAPGEAILVRDGRIARRWTWYELPVFRGAQGDLGVEESVRGVDENLRRAVQRQLVADVPVGAFLSGGLDSSAVVAYAREQAPEIRCFTIESAGGAESGTSDDLPYAKRAAAHLKVPLDVVQVDAGRMADDLAHMVAHLDEPLADPSPLNVLYISRLARDNGIKVLLSGAGGDDLFTGYRRHAALYYEPLWRWLPQSVRAALERGGSSLDQRKPLQRRLAKLVSGAAAEGNERLVAYFAWRREAELLPLYSPAFRQSLGGAVAAAPMLSFLEPLGPTVPPLEKMLALEQRFFLADHNLLYTDKMSMAAGVEVRVPFLDADLVEHAARIPMKLKQRGRVGKWVLKKAMEPYLPHDIIYRPKTGFGAPVRRWLKHELRDFVDDTLSREALNRRGLFDPAAVRRLVELDRQGQIDGAYTVFSLVCIELWCRRFLDAHPCAGPARIVAATY